MKKALGALVVLSIGAAFGAGYWLQRERAVRAEAEQAEMRRQLDETRDALDRAETLNRLGRVFGHYLSVRDAVVAGNYGDAQSLSSAFFDGVGDEAGRQKDATVRTALDAVLMRRDTVTAALARGEGAVRGPLDLIERELRRALGYAVPALPVPDAAPSPAPAPQARP